MSAFRRLTPALSAVSSLYASGLPQMFPGLAHVPDRTCHGRAVPALSPFNCTVTSLARLSVLGTIVAKPITFDFASRIVAEYSRCRSGRPNSAEDPANDTNTASTIRDPLILLSQVLLFTGISQRAFRFCRIGWHGPFVQYARAGYTGIVAPGTFDLQKARIVTKNAYSVLAALKHAQEGAQTVFTTCHSNSAEETW